jgi:hypothetical protein
MTDTAPSHLDLDQLADALAGEPQEHLAGCADCTSRLAELRAAEAGVVAALRALPDPALPAGLADRLAAAFDAEPPLAARRSNVTALPDPAPRRRLLPVAAAAVLALSAGGIGYAVVSGSGVGSSGDDAATSQAAGGQAAPPTSASGTDYADAAAVAGVLPGVLAGGAGSGELLDSSAADSARAESSDDSAGATTMQAPAAAPLGDPLERLRTPEGLEDCLSAVLPPEEPDVRPRALDYAQYQGQPALAVVLPDPDPAKLSVYVVGAECAAADARLLGFFRLDAP